MFRFWFAKWILEKKKDLYKSCKGNVLYLSFIKRMYCIFAKWERYYQSEQSGRKSLLFQICIYVCFYINSLTHPCLLKKLLEINWIYLIPNIRVEMRVLIYHLVLSQCLVVYYWGKTKVVHDSVEKLLSPLLVILGWCGSMSHFLYFLFF